MFNKMIEKKDETQKLEAKKIRKKKFQRVAEDIINYWLPLTAAATVGTIAGMMIGDKILQWRNDSIITIEEAVETPTITE